MSSTIIDFIKESIEFVFENSVLIKRLRVVAILLSGFAGALLLISDSLQSYLSHTYLIDPAKTGLLSIVICISILTLQYLQSGSGISFDVSDEIRIETPDPILTRIEQRISALEVQPLAQSHTDGISTRIDLTAEDRAKLVEAAAQNIKQEMVESVFNSKAEALILNTKTNFALDHLKISSRTSLDRLRREISDLRLRANVNLILGMMITLVGLFLLWTTVNILDTSTLLRNLATEDGASYTKFFKSLMLPLAPRVSLVIFVEIFAYFFLRLYRDGLSEIKYFQNELTNMEAKLLAVEFSFAANATESLRTALDALTKTERNHILEKGQTTVELERAKSDSALSKKLISIIPNIFKSSKPDPD